MTIIWHDQLIAQWRNIGISYLAKRACPRVCPLTSNRHHLSYDDCLENKGRLQDCSCSTESYHCIQCYAHILWAAPTGQTDMPLSHWVHFTVLRCICVFVFSCISLHACCIIVTRWGGPGGIEAWSDDWPSSFSALTLLVGSHDL